LDKNGSGVIEGGGGFSGLHENSCGTAGSVLERGVFRLGQGNLFKSSKDWLKNENRMVMMNGRECIKNVLKDC
jgi:hypothetical protein